MRGAYRRNKNQRNQHKFGFYLSTDQLEIFSKVVKIKNNLRHKIDFIAYGLDTLYN